jgi:tetratricopeptide (TPR) repeat protein
LQSDLSADAERVSALNEEYKLDRHQTLKKQGDALYQQRKFEDACLLYSRALVICNPFITCLSNRAAANLVRQRFAACVYDCTLALSHMENLKNKSESSDKAPSSSIGACLEQQLTEAESKKLRVRLLSRRGAANIGLDNLIAAKQDYSLAVAADPHDLGLIQDLQRINQRIREMNENIKSDESAASTVAPSTAAVSSDVESKNEILNDQSTSVSAQPPSPPLESVPVPAVTHVTPVVAESSNAAALFQSGKFAQALESFSAQVRAAPSNANLLLNRAACHLALKDCVGCIADCNRALELLNAPVDSYHQGELDTRASLECVALTRRATASCWLGDAALAVEDLKAIVALSSSNPRCLTAAELQCTVNDLKHAEKLASVQVK